MGELNGGADGESAKIKEIDGCERNLRIMQKERKGV